MITAIVGSENPVKIRAALKGLQIVYGMEPVVTGVNLSGVLGLSIPAQPMTMEVTRDGAIKRAVHSRLSGKCDLGVGLEGGLAQVGGEWFCVSWAAVADQCDHVFSAMGPAVWVAPELMRLVESGLELGDAQDQHFGLVNSKQDTGLIGVITENRVTRDDVFSIPVTTAICSMRMTLTDRGRVST